MNRRTSPNPTPGSRTSPKEDLRVRRTKTHLRRALAELMSRRTLSSIGVTEVCELAMVHRTTFYKHYADKQALFEDLLDERVDRLLTRAGLPADRPAQRTQRPVGQLILLLEQLRGDAPLLALLSDSDLATAFTPRLTRALVTHLQDRAPRAASQSAAMRADLLAHLHAAVLSAAMSWWAQSSTRMEPEELATIVWEALGPGVDPP